MLIIKILLSMLSVIGLLISLGHMLGRFKDKDRIAFLRNIEADLTCPSDHPGAVKFVDEFVRAAPEYKTVKIEFDEIDEIFFTGQWVGHSNVENGRHVDSISAGTLKLRSITGKVSKPLCSYEDLKKWSKESPFWKWLGWWIIALSVFLGIVVLVVEEYAKQTSTI